MKPFFLLIFFLSLYNYAVAFQNGNNSIFSNSRDTVKLINSRSNSLYAGIDNYLAINKNYIPYKNIIVEIERGMAMDDGNFYMLMVGRPGTTTLYIYQYDKGDTILCFKKSLKIFPVPTPFISLNGQAIENIESITIQELKENKGFEVQFSNDFIDDSNWYSVKSIVVGYSYGKVYVTRTCDGKMLTDEIINELSRLSPGKEIAFTFTLAGTGDVYKRLEPIRLKLK